MTATGRFVQKAPHNSNFSNNNNRNFLFPISLVFSVIILFIIIYQVLTYGTAEESTIYQPLILGDVSAFPIHILDNDQPLAGRKNKSCTHFGCFNLYKCGIRGNKLTVYVYPPSIFIDSSGKSVNSGQMSREFYQILQSIISSKFYTPNPREACVFIPPIDTLNQNHLKLSSLSQALKSLEFWNNGENHLLFNMVPGSSPDFNTSLDAQIDRAMIAGAGFSSMIYRTGFDISLPVFSTLAGDLDRKLEKKRFRFLISSQMNVNGAFEQDILEISSMSPQDVLVLGPCLHHNPVSSSIRCLGEQVFKYPEVLQTSTFCLIVRGPRLGHSALLDALAAGCIPVIISDEVVMPFHEIIDWKRAAIFIREVDILSMISTLKKISPMRIEELKSQSYWLWDTYFQSMNKITETTLEILSDRIFGQLARDYNHWNVPEFTPNQKPPLFLSITAPKTHGFTAVILTYDRLELLFSLINKIVEVPSCSKILVIWNNQRKDPPPPQRWPKLNKPLQVIRTKENKLSNRFYPYDEIETEAILSIDDDIIMLTSDELEFAYEVWREFPDRIVGFPSRTHTWDNVTNCWKYESEWTNRISMVLTGAAFHHKYWSYYYTTSMPGDIKYWVDEHMNCEDIAMNFLVANVTGKAPIKVTPKKKFRCPECTNTEMLSADLAHMAERTECINRFTRIYNTMPLKSVEFRADPVLFKDVFPDKLKRFNGIGSL